MAVGGNPENRHGIILTADYIAKKYGVKAGMPLWQAKQLCPEITFVSPRMDLYLKFSKMAKEIYSEYSDLQEPFGIDESWLDISQSCIEPNNGYIVAKEISERMKTELGVTVSVGVSFNKIFAKLGSDYKKPDAITTMYRNEFKTKAWELPAGDLLYVGKRTEDKLSRYGIKTIGDIANTEEKLMVAYLGKMGSVLWRFANGYDDSPVKAEYSKSPIKSIGNSTTTPRDLVSNEDVKIVLYLLAESVGSRLRKNGFLCKVIEVSIRDNELMTTIKHHKLDKATNITEEIAKESLNLFISGYDWKKPVRSIGIRAAELVNNDYWEQIDIFTDVKLREKMEKVDKAVDDVRRRFGYFSIQRGVMYEDKQLSSLDCESTHTVYPKTYFG